MIAQINPLYIKTRPSKVFKRFISYIFFEGRPLTTKGRWINPFLFAAFALIKRMPQMKKVKKPIYIIGTGRSGTTILGIVLSMHKDVGFLNEPKAMWHSVYPNEDIIGSYSPGKTFYRLSANRVDERIKKAAHRIFGMYLFSTFSKVVVDKYPELIFRTSFVKAIFPDAKFLFLVRSPWDTCHSIEGWSRRKGSLQNGKIQDWWGLNDRKWKLFVDQLVNDDNELKNYASEIQSFSNHRERALVEWILTMKQGHNLLEECSEFVFKVKFEDLTNHPEDVLQRISHFCGLRKDKKFITYAVHTLSPPPPHQHFEIPSCLKKAFTNMMRKMGYE